MVQSQSKHCNASISRHIILRLPDDSHRSICIKISWNVGELKDFVALYLVEYALQPADFRLTLDGKPLHRNDIQLELYNIQQHARIVVTANCCMLGGARNSDAALADRTNGAQEVTPHWPVRSKRRRESLSPTMLNRNCHQEAAHSKQRRKGQSSFTQECDRNECSGSTVTTVASLNKRVPPATPVASHIERRMFLENVKDLYGHTVTPDRMKVWAVLGYFLGRILIDPVPKRRLCSSNPTKLVNDLLQGFGEPVQVAHFRVNRKTAAPKLKLDDSALVTALSMFACNRTKAKLSMDQLKSLHNEFCSKWKEVIPKSQRILQMSIDMNMLHVPKQCVRHFLLHMYHKKSLDHHICSVKNVSPRPCSVPLPKDPPCLSTLLLRCFLHEILVDSVRCK